MYKKILNELLRNTKTLKGCNIIIMEKLWNIFCYYYYYYKNVSV